MPETMPQNSGETAYIAFAMVDGLISLLMTRRLIDASEVDRMFESISESLRQVNNFDCNGAAKFITDRMTSKE
jgi:hypothetical protein